MEIEKYREIQDLLDNDPRLQQKRKIGWCRVWTGLALETVGHFIAQQGIPMTVEAREVEIEPFVFHTFLLAVLEGSPPFVYDGTGTAVFPPFAGWEAEAPHLQNSKYDQINYYVTRGSSGAEEPT